MKRTIALSPDDSRDKHAEVLMTNECWSNILGLGNCVRMADHLNRSATSSREPLSVSPRSPCSKDSDSLGSFWPSSDCESSINAAQAASSDPRPFMREFFSVPENLASAGKQSSVFAGKDTACSSHTRFA